MQSARKIIVIALGSDGDINPMIAIARELQSKGNTVEFLASGYFEEKVKALGLQFFAIGDPSLYEKALQSKDVWHPYNAFKAMWKIMYETLPLTYEVLKSRYEPGDLIVGSSLAFAARILQEQVGAKYATVHLQPSITISAHTPPVGPPGALPKAMPLVLKQFYIGMLDKFLLDAACRSDLNEFRQKFDLPPIKNVFTKWIHSPDLVIMAWPEWFAPPQPDWPKNSACTDFPIFEHDGIAEISSATSDFLNSGAPPVVFTAGSAMAQGAKHFKCAAETLRNGDLRGIFVCKFRDMVPEDLPSNVHHSMFEPFDKLFPLAAAVQHHGGIGTSIQCMRAGKPQLITPFAHDQFDNAHRLALLGIAETSKENNPSEWHRKLLRIIGDNEVRTQCDLIKSRINANPHHVEQIAKAILKLA